MACCGCNRELLGQILTPQVLLSPRCCSHCSGQTQSRFGCAASWAMPDNRPVPKLRGEHSHHLDWVKQHKRRDWLRVPPWETAAYARRAGATIPSCFCNRFLTVIPVGKSSLCSFGSGDHTSRLTQAGRCLRLRLASSHRPRAPASIARLSKVQTTPLRFLRCRSSP